MNRLSIEPMIKFVRFDDGAYDVYADGAPVGQVYQCHGPRGGARWTCWDDATVTHRTRFEAATELIANFGGGR